MRIAILRGEMKEPDEKHDDVILWMVLLFALLAGLTYFSKWN